MRGSFIRAQKEAIARRSQRSFSLWVNWDYRQALALRIREKCAIAARHDNHGVVAESWLVVSAGMPRWGAVASTTIVPDLVDTSELNPLFHDILSASRFQRAFLVLHMNRTVFGWNRQGGWCVVADADAGERERHRRRMNDLIFNEIPAHYRRRSTG